MQKIIFHTMEKLDFRSRESYKTLRTNLEFSGKNCKVISITSCTPNEGKSSVSFQLALSMAEAGKKVMMVDADLRKSILRSRYKAGATRYGLSHYLSGQASIPDIVYDTNIQGMNVILTGPVPPNPSELLGNEYFKMLIDYLRNEYDFIIVDTPPLGSVIDGAVVAKRCDGTVIVIESGAISYKFVQNIKLQLQKLDCRILGVVMNKVKMTTKGYYGKYYGKYYGSYYGSDVDDSMYVGAGSVKKSKQEKTAVVSESIKQDKTYEANPGEQASADDNELLGMDMVNLEKEEIAEDDIEMIDVK